MRAHEFLCEQTHEDQARDALITLLTTQHALGIPEIDTDKLLQSLEDRNFFMDADWISAQVSDIPVVDAESSTPDNVVLRLPRKPGQNSASDAGDADVPVMPDSSDRVAQMARKALAKRNP
jgi:hypothetical protein